MSLLDLTANIKSLILQNDWGDKSYIINDIRDLVNKIEVQGYTGSLISPVVSSNTEIKKVEKQSAASQFEYLKKLLETDQWPESVYSFQIADESSESDKTERAEGIVDVLFQHDLNNMKFLDFGCGEGHVAKYCSNNSSVSVGYDIIKAPNSSFAWEELTNNFLLTNDFDKVKENGPYDIILLYDVLDHAIVSSLDQHNSMVQLLYNAKSVLSPEGTIYLRCHPWCSRHGGHLYRKLNKAFLHLVFSEEELGLLGLNLEPIHKVLAPLFTYDNVIKDAKLKKITESIEKQQVESFFSSDSVIKDRLLSTWGIKFWGDRNTPEFQMSQCFVDYTLKHF